jgi:hypothetical protein
MGRGALYDLKRFLYMTFGVLPSENFFHLLKSVFPDDTMVLLELLFNLKEQHQLENIFHIGSIYLDISL